MGTIVNFGIKLKKLRTTQELSQDDLAKKLGLKRATISSYERGAMLPSVEVQMCIRDRDGTITRDFPPTIEELAECEPVYEEIEGFSGDLENCRSYDELPDSCKRYIEKLEELCECPIKMVGVGPARDQNLER